MVIQVITIRKFPLICVYSLYQGAKEGLVEGPGKIFEVSEKKHLESPQDCDSGPLEASSVIIEIRLLDY